MQNTQNQAQASINEKNQWEVKIEDRVITTANSQVQALEIAKWMNDHSCGAISC
jgi:hypothetical protein